MAMPALSVCRISAHVQRFQLTQAASPAFGGRVALASRRFYALRTPPTASACSATSAATTRSPAAPTTCGAAVSAPTSSMFALNHTRSMHAMSQMPLWWQAAATSQQRRWQATQSASSGDAGQAKPGGEQQQQGAPGGEAGNAGENAKADPKAEQQNLSSFAKLKQDIINFPDIYNWANMINMAVFTVFCLCSTGTEGEAKWWVDFWGVDSTGFQPWAWLGHAVLTNNFLAMTFAMILFHSLAHATQVQIGGPALLAFCMTVSFLSGACMYLSQSALGNSGLTVEKQFGPWDVIAALMVFQFFSTGTTPWGLLLSYNGWVRYANLVGAVCILWYDPQPMVWGTLIGLALTKGKVFKPAVAAV